MEWIDNRSRPRPYQQKKTENRKAASPAPTIRYAYPVYQGTCKILLQKERRNILHSCALDRLDFCCAITQPTTENRKKRPVPHCRPLHSTAKAATLLRRLVVVYAVALPPHPRPRPKNRKFCVEFGHGVWYNYR